MDTSTGGGELGSRSPRVLNTFASPPSVTHPDANLQTSGTSFVSRDADSPWMLRPLAIRSPRTARVLFGDGPTQHIGTNEANDGRDEDSGSSDLPSRPEKIRRLDRADSTTFPYVLYDVLEDERSRPYIQWTEDPQLGFFIPDVEEFSNEVLRRSFKGISKWGSFVRQLSNYGFKKVGRGTKQAHYVHKNGNFRRGRPDLLSQVVRSEERPTIPAAPVQRFNLPMELSENPFAYVPSPAILPPALTSSSVVVAAPSSSLLRPGGSDDLLPWFLNTQVKMNGLESDVLRLKTHVVELQDRSNKLDKTVVDLKDEVARLKSDNLALRVEQNRLLTRLDTLSSDARTGGSESGALRDWWQPAFPTQHIQTTRLPHSSFVTIQAGDGRGACVMTPPISNERGRGYEPQLEGLLAERSQIGRFSTHHTELVPIRRRDSDTSRPQLAARRHDTSPPEVSSSSTRLFGIAPSRSQETPSPSDVISSRVSEGQDKQIR